MFIDFYLDCSHGAGVLGDRLSMNHGHCPPHLKLRDSWTWTRWIAHDPGMPISSSQCFVDMGCAVFECQGRRKWGYPNDGPWIWDAHPIRTTVQILRASPMVCFLDGYSARYYLSGGKQFKTRLYSFKNWRTISNYIFVRNDFFCLGSTGLSGIVASTATISYRVGDRTSTSSINLRIIWLPTD